MLCAVGLNGKAGVAVWNFRGTAEDDGLRGRRKLLQIHLLLKSTWKAFGGHKHHTCCSGPALCLENGLLLYAQHQQSLQENAPHGTLTPGLKNVIWTVCAVRFPLAHCGGCSFPRSLFYSLPYYYYSGIFCYILCWERKVPWCAWMSRSVTQHSAPSRLSQTPHQSLSREKKAHVKGMFTLMLFKWATVQIKLYLGIAVASQ